MNNNKIDPEFTMHVSDKNLFMLELFARGGLIQLETDSIILFSDTNLLKNLWNKGDKLPICPKLVF